jgi:hypothetical protein
MIAAVKLVPRALTLEECYEFGFDAAVKGPNEDNCNFGIFRDKEHTHEWTRGNKAGEAWKARAKKETLEPETQYCQEWPEYGGKR